MQNYSQQANVIDLVAPYAVNAGQGAQVGSMFGVAVSTLASGAAGPFLRVGRCNAVTKKSAQAWAQGDKIYWDNTNKWLSNAPADGIFVGHACAAAADPSSTGDVVLVPSYTVTTGAPADVADVATANATDLASAEALANQLKTTLNALLDGLRTAGIIQ